MPSGLLPTPLVGVRGPSPRRHRRWAAGFLPRAEDLAQAEGSPVSLVHPSQIQGITRGHRATPPVTSTLNQAPSARKRCRVSHTCAAPADTHVHQESELTRGCAHTPREQGSGRKGREPEPWACVALTTSLRGDCPLELTPRGVWKGHEPAERQLFLAGRQVKGPDLERAMRPSVTP